VADCQNRTVSGTEVASAAPTRWLFNRTLAAGPAWIGLAPAFYLGWLPWWYGLIIVPGLVVSESWAEFIGRSHA